MESKSIGMNDFYLDYVKRINRVKESDFRKICNMYNKFMYNEVIEGREAKMPYGLGSIYIQKIETDWDKPPVNWKETKKEGKLVYHINEETNNLIMRFKWNFRNRKMMNMVYYAFKPCFANRRNASKEFKKNGGKIYREV